MDMNMAEASSDVDPSDAAQSGQIKLKLKLNLPPMPRHFLGIGLSAREQARLMAEITQRINAATHLLQRPVTQEEATALAQGAIKMRAIVSYATPLGLAGGFYQAYSSRATWRFPFYTPPPDKFNPDRFWMVAAGPKARVLWHALRATAYGSIGWVLAQIFVGNYAATTVAVQEMRDPRLKHYVEAVSRAKDVGARARAGIPAPAPGQSAGAPVGAGAVRSRTPAAAGEDWSGAAGDDGRLWRGKTRVARESWVAGDFTWRVGAFWVWLEDWAAMRNGDRVDGEVILFLCLELVDSPGIY